jgi:hypothetical protein
MLDALNYYLDVYNILRVRRKEMHADENENIFYVLKLMMDLCLAYVLFFQTIFVFSLHPQPLSSRSHLSHRRVKTTVHFFLLIFG